MADPFNAEVGKVSDSILLIPIRTSTNTRGTTKVGHGIRTQMSPGIDVDPYASQLTEEDHVGQVGPTTPRQYAQPINMPNCKMGEGRVATSGITQMSPIEAPPPPRDTNYATQSNILEVDKT